MLAGPGKLSAKPLAKETHPSMAFADASAFYRSLDSPTARLVKFYLCTFGGPRLAPYLSARWNQIDLQAKVWRVPREQTKSGRAMVNAGKVPEPFVVPPSDEAIRILGPARAGHELLFQGPHACRLYDVSLADFGRTDSDMHGLRSTARSWADTLGPTWYYAAKASLHHGQGGKRDPDGRRGGNHDWLDERRHLLEMWADYLTAR
jgi:integrase